MANIEVRISDEAILEYLRKERGLDEGKGRIESIEVEQYPPVQNSKVSHIVTVRVQFGLDLGELRKLAEF